MQADTVAATPACGQSSFPRRALGPAAGFSGGTGTSIASTSTMHTDLNVDEINQPAGDNNPRPRAEENAAAALDELCTKARKKLNQAEPKRYGKTTNLPTIYKVPDELKGGVSGQKDYCPVAVYLGGFVRPRYERSWLSLEEYKWWCVQQLIVRHGARDRIEVHDLVHMCIRKINDLLPEVVGSYSQDMEIVGLNEMTERMLLDGCLILHRLLRHTRGGNERENDDWTQTFGRCWVWQSVTRDMLLLENQVPFLVIKELFHQLKKKDGESEDLLFDGSLGMFRSLRLTMHRRREGEKVHHLLHLFYISVVFRPDEEKKPSKKPYGDEVDVFLPDLTQWVPSVKELEEAGVSFRKKKDAPTFLDISFDSSRGVLEIPPLQLYDSSSALFRNLIAFEQTYPATRCDVSAYTAFMDCLIKTPEDMRILHLRGILVNQMNGEHDANRFFSQVCAEVRIPADNYLVDLMEKVSKYKDSRRHNWRAALMRNYFGNPWMAISVFAAMLLLALTILQTFFTVYPYYNKHS